MWSSANGLYHAFLLQSPLKVRAELPTKNYDNFQLGAPHWNLSHLNIIELYRPRTQHDKCGLASITPARLFYDVFWKPRKPCLLLPLLTQDISCNVLELGSGEKIHGITYFMRESVRHESHTRFRYKYYYCDSSRLKVFDHFCFPSDWLLNSRFAWYSQLLQLHRMLDINPFQAGVKRKKWKEFWMNPKYHISHIVLLIYTRQMVSFYTTLKNDVSTVQLQAKHGGLGENVIVRCQGFTSASMNIFPYLQVLFWTHCKRSRSLNPCLASFVSINMDQVLYSYAYNSIRIVPGQHARFHLKRLSGESTSFVRWWLYILRLKNHWRRCYQTIVRRNPHTSSFLLKRVWLAKRLQRQECAFLWL